MALITRLSRLFQADFHAVLDRIEEPDLQLQQAVREMQFALDQDRQRAKLLQHEQDQLDKAAHGAETQLQVFDEELDTCLAAKKDDLARDLVRRKLGAEKQLAAVTRQHAIVTRQIGELTRQIDERGEQLASMQQKLDLLVQNDAAFDPGNLASGDTIRNEEIEIALLREKERRAQA